jgi:hypothetical protein
MTADLHFMMIVDDPEVAHYVSANGVKTLFVDLEWKGKEVRQPKAESWKSKQTPRDVTRIREAAPDSELLVRLNPSDEGTPGEIEDALARGADALMLPMFRDAGEVFRFHDLVRGRATVVPLFETVSSLRALPDIADSGSLDRAHIGLNDLHLELGMRFMFQPLAEGYIEESCAVLREHSIAFGIGGLARVGEGILDPALLVGEHVRLGSTWAILSRTFHRHARNLDEFMETTDLEAEIAALREIYTHFAQSSQEALELNRRRAADRVRDVLQLIAAS